MKLLRSCCDGLFTFSLSIYDISHGLLMCVDIRYLFPDQIVVSLEVSESFFDELEFYC